MGSKKKKAPVAPDYTALANQQAALNNAQVREQTQANRPDQVNPYGSMKWSQDPATGKWTQTETWDPRITGAMDQSLAMQQQQMGQVQDLLKQGGFEGGPELPQYSGANITRGAMPAYNADVADQYSKRFTESLMGRVRPQQEQQQQAMATRLRLQGLQPGTEAYDRAYKNLLTSHGDVSAQAELQGMLAGAGEARNMYQSELAGQGQDFNQQLQQAGLGLEEYGAQLAGQQQGFGQDLQKYLLPWQTAGMTQGLGNNIRTPQFAGFSQAGAGEGARVMDAAQQQYAQQMQQYNEAQQRRSGKGGALGSLAGAVGGSFFGMPTLGASVGSGLGSMFSDNSLKEEIGPLNDQECYEAIKEFIPVKWRWSGTSVEDAGLSAQSVAEIMPHLVERAERGLLKVNYSKFCALLLGAFRHMASKESANVGHAA